MKTTDWWGFFCYRPQQRPYLFNQVQITPNVYDPQGSTMLPDSCLTLRYVVFRYNILIMTCNWLYSSIACTCLFFCVSTGNEALFFLLSLGPHSFLLAIFKFLENMIYWIHNVITLCYSVLLNLQGTLCISALSLCLFSWYNRQQNNSNTILLTKINSFFPLRCCFIPYISPPFLKVRFQ